MVISNKVTNTYKKDSTRTELLDIFLLSAIESIHVSIVHWKPWKKCLNGLDVQLKEEKMNLVDLIVSRITYIPLVHRTMITRDSLSLIQQYCHLILLPAPAAARSRKFLVRRCFLFTCNLLEAIPHVSSEAKEILSSFFFFSLFNLQLSLSLYIYLFFYCKEVLYKYGQNNRESEKKETNIKHFRLSWN